MSIFEIETRDRYTLKINDWLCDQCVFFSDVKLYSMGIGSNKIKINVDFEMKEIEIFIKMLKKIMKNEYFCLFEWVRQSYENINVITILNLSEYFQCERVTKFMCKQIAKKINKSNKNLLL